MSEPMSEDDYPEDVHVVSFPPFKLEGDNISLNYIKEGDKCPFRPLNVQLDNSEVQNNKKTSKSE